MKRGELVEAEGVLRDAAGEIVPRTARGFMARHQFMDVAPLGDLDMLAVNRSAQDYELRRNRTPDWCRQLNERYCTVPTINGVVDLEPDADASVHFNVIQISYFRTFNDNHTVPGKNADDNGLGTAWLLSPSRPQYTRLGFWMPGEEPAGALNLWSGLVMTKPPTSARLVTEYVHEVVAAGRDFVRDYVLDWLAWKLQNPLCKHGVNLVLFGPKGTGKSTLGELTIDMLGRKYAMSISSDKHLLGRFNGHLEGKVMLLVDEALFDKNPAVGCKYKDLTTKETMQLERNGIDARTVANMLSFIVTSNRLAGVSFEPMDRRSSVMEVSPVHRNDTAYFRALWEEWNDGGREAFMQELLARDVSRFDPRIPLDLPEKADMAQTTADVPTRWWIDVLAAGALPGGGDWTKPATVLNIDLEAAHAAWCSLNACKPASRPELARRVNELCPSRSPIRTAAAGRPRGYVYPPLEECRRLAGVSMGSGETAVPSRHVQA